MARTPSRLLRWLRRLIPMHPRDRPGVVSKGAREIQSERRHAAIRERYDKAFRRYSEQIETIRQRTGGNQ